MWIQCDLLWYLSLFTVDRYKYIFDNNIMMNVKDVMTTRVKSYSTFRLSELVSFPC
jgi:hypothetical protein